MKISDEELNKFFENFDVKLQKCFDEIEELALVGNRIRDKIIPFKESSFDIGSLYIPYSALRIFYLRRQANEYDRGIELSVHFQYNSFSNEENKAYFTKYTSDKLYLWIDIYPCRDNDFTNFEWELGEGEIKTIEFPNQLNGELVEEICLYLSLKANIIAKTLNDIVLEDESRVN
ncbi:MAG: hypothetical protein F9K23_00100 [Bacteroidetes bacterium]|nr:MAG: hypothetical protein F9K23_00100 [Bacteroidota bacterium]